MLKIKGLDKLQRELADAQKAFAEVDGELGSISFDPASPESIEAAIVAMEQLLDDRLGQYSRNSFVQPLLHEMKEKYRAAIIEKAAVARIKSEEDDGN